MSGGCKVFYKHIVKLDRALATEKQNRINVILITLIYTLTLDDHTNPVIWHAFLMNALPHTYQITGLELIH
jgi:hypothetical protein